MFAAILFGISKSLVNFSENKKEEEYIQSLN